MAKVIRMTESQLKQIINGVINEQMSASQMFKVGEVYSGDRSVDGKTYLIYIKDVAKTPGETWVSAGIKGPGTYQNQQLNGSGGFELYIGKSSAGSLSLVGNNEMGKFSNVAKVNNSLVQKMGQDKVKTGSITQFDEMKDDGSESPERVSKYHDDVEKIKFAIQWMYEHVNDFFDIPAENLEYFGEQEMFNELKDQYDMLDETAEGFDVSKWAKRQIRSIFEDMENDQ